MANVEDGDLRSGSVAGSETLPQREASASPWRTVWFAPYATGAALRRRNRITDLAQPVLFFVAAVVVVSLFLATFEYLWGDTYTPWRMLLTEIGQQVLHYLSRGVLFAVGILIAATVIAIVQKKTSGHAGISDILAALLWGALPLAIGVVIHNGTPWVYHDVDNNGVVIDGVGYLTDEWWVSKGLRVAAWYAIVLSIVPAFWMTTQLLAGVSELSARQGFVQVICSTAAGLATVWLIILVLQFSASQVAPLPYDSEPLGLSPLESLPPAPE